MKKDKYKIVSLFAVVVVILQYIIVMIDTSLPVANYLRVIRDSFGIIAILLVLNKNDKEIVVTYIISFMILLILSLRSHDVFVTFINLIRVYVSFGFVFVGYYIFNYIDNKIIYKLIIVLSVVFYIYIIMANLINYGDQQYEGSMYIGYYTGADLYVKSIFVVMSLGFIIYNRSININYVVLFVNAILLSVILIAIFRRTSLVIILISTVFLLYYMTKNKSNNKYFYLMATIIVMLSVLYGIKDEAYKAIERRGGVERFVEIEREFRFQEIFITYGILDYNNSLLYGTGNLFTEREILSSLWTDRRLHGDISLYLFGTGVIGLFTILTLIIAILKKLPYKSTMYGYYSIVLSLSYIFILFIGGTYKLLYHITIMLLFGMLIRNKKNKL